MYVKLSRKGSAPGVFAFSDMYRTGKIKSGAYGETTRGGAAQTTTREECSKVIYSKNTNRRRVRTAHP